MIADAADRAAGVGPFDRVEDRIADHRDFKHINAGRFGDVRAERDPFRRNVDCLLCCVNDQLPAVAVFPVGERERRPSVSGQQPAGEPVVIQRDGLHAGESDGFRDRQQMAPVFGRKGRFGDVLLFAVRINAGLIGVFRRGVQRIRDGLADAVQKTDRRSVLFAARDSERALVVRGVG